LQNPRSSSTSRPVATEAVAPPPPGADAVHPEPPRARIRSPGTSSLLSPHFPPLTRSVLPVRRNPRNGRAELELRRRLAGAPSRPRQIAWASTCASSSSTSSPSGASRDAVVSPASTKYREHHRRPSSPIPATAVLPVRRRPSLRVRGEHAVLPDPFPLSIAVRGVA
jgi:hypothetical protein